MERVAQPPQPPLVYLDTHIVAWLHAGRAEELSAAAAARIATGRLRVSPMAELELQYLYELGRLSVKASRVVGDLAQELGLQRGDFPFAQVVASAASFSWTRDPFDRLIVAEASAAGAELVTRDRTIRRHFKGAIW